MAPFITAPVTGDDFIVGKTPEMRDKRLGRRPAVNLTRDENNPEPFIPGETPEQARARRERSGIRTTAEMMRDQVEAAHQGKQTTSWQEARLGQRLDAERQEREQAARAEAERTVRAEQEQARERTQATASRGLEMPPREELVTVDPVGLAKGQIETVSF